MKITEEQLAILNDSFPVIEGSSEKLILPRFGMLSKDITETSGTGKNKKIKVLQSAGTFFSEREHPELDEDGKRVWVKTYFDKETIDVVIVYHRRQLRMYDSSLEKFYSTPIFDKPDQVIPLYLDKQVVKKGTQAELQAMFPAVTLKGKPSSKLKEEIILFLLVNGELHQCSLSQSSKYEYLTYAKSVNPSACITTLSSVEDEFGDNVFRKMTFKKSRIIDGNEFELIKESQDILISKVESDKKFFLPAQSTADQELEAIASASSKLD